MQTNTTDFVFVMVVFGLCTVFAVCTATMIYRFKRGLPPRDPVTVPKRIHADPYNEIDNEIEALKKSMGDSMTMMQNAPSIEMLEEEQQEEQVIENKEKSENIFDKFKASRVKRKQAPESKASPVIKSLRGKK